MHSDQGTQYASAPYQAQVMNAIYGEKGVKAGYADGECKVDRMQAIEHLAGRLTLFGGQDTLFNPRD